MGPLATSEGQAQHNYTNLFLVFVFIYFFFLKRTKSEIAENMMQPTRLAAMLGPAGKL